MTQYIALFIFSYFMSMPVLAAMVANVPGSHRTTLWTEPKGWLYLIQPYTRLLIATVMVVCAALGGVFDA
jgi:putative exporter of polyketide antibiotics